MAGGRPSQYDPAYCEVIETLLGDGYSVMAAAGHIGVCRETVYNWANEHDEFFHAVKRGRAKAAIWWENKLRGIVQGEDGNVTAAIFGLKNRAADEWRDVNRVEQTGADGGAIKHDHGAATERLASFLNDRSAKPGG